MQQTFLSSTFFGLQLDLPTNFREGRVKMYVELQVKTKKSPHINQQVFCKIINLEESYKIRGP